MVETTLKELEDPAEDYQVYQTLQHFTTTQAEEKAYFKRCREKMQLACTFFEECISKAQVVAKTEVVSEGQ